jgi:hypothetical protein
VASQNPRNYWLEDVIEKEQAKLQGLRERAGKLVQALESIQ